jgi:alpha-galactosidase
MPKSTLIGAGSVVFTLNLCSDILLTPALQESTIALMDIAPERLEQARNIVQAIVDHRGLKARVEATLDRREAVEGADYVITTFQQGGLDAYRLDIEIPQRYGVEHSAWAIPLGRAGFSAGCEASLCSLICAKTWTIWLRTR